MFEGKKRQLAALPEIRNVPVSAARIGPQELDLLKDTLRRELHTRGVSGRSG